MVSLIKSVKSECYTKTQLCHCCLSTDRVLRPILEYQNILLRLIGDDTYKKSRRTSKYLLCWECIAVLRKISFFQRKVIKAQTLLNKKEVLNFSSLSNLSKNTLEPTSYDYTAEIYVEGTKIEIELEKEELLDITEDHLEEDEDPVDNTEYEKEELLDITEDHPEEYEDPVDNPEYDSDYTEVEKPNSKFKIRKVLKSEENYDVVLSELNVKLSKLSTTLENNKIITEQIRNSDLFKKSNFNCQKCVEIFPNKSLKRIHCANFHYKNAVHACDSCDSRFRRKEQLDEHFKTHFYIYKCSDCPTVTATENQNKEHFRLNHRKKYSCKKCSMTFGKINEFRLHHKRLHEKYVCTKCEKECLSQEKLQRHIQRFHTEQHCLPCQKTFGTFKSFQTHQYMYHSGTGNSYCVECDKSFITANRYKQHLLGSAHQPRYGKVFSCPECDKRYSSKISMNNHYSYVHLGKSKHCCVPCNRIFLSSTKLGEHVRRIHEQRQLPKNKLCTICGRGFTTNRTLIHHVRTHTGERPHECAHCPAKFAQKAAMMTHVKAIHMKHK